MSSSNINLPLHTTTQELYCAGTHSFNDNEYSLSSLEQDVNNSLNLMPGTPSTLPSHDEPLSAQDDAWPGLSPFNIIDDDGIQPLQRYDSDLNPEAKPFVSNFYPWPNTSYAPLQTSQRLQQQRLTPLNTNIGGPSQSSYNPPAVQEGAYLPQHAISPSLMVTDDLSSISLASVQWPAPQQPIGQWLQASYHAGAQQDVSGMDMDMDMLTPISPYASTQGRSRSSSIASAASYNCDHAGCHKVFKSKTDFSHHLRNHGPRKHACPHCSSRFVFKKDMKRHTQIHTPENKNFFCTISGCQWAERGFQRKDHWKRHLRTHHPKQTGLHTPYTGSAPMSRSASYQ